MPTVTGAGVKAAREEQALSQRKLARRVAERLGEPERATALGVLLSRLERRESADLDDEVAKALAEELAVGVGDLKEGVLYTWAHRLEGDRYSFPALALRQVLFNSSEAAADGRDIFAAELEPLGLNIARGATLVPVFREAIRRTMEAHFGELAEHELERLIVVDPSAKAVRELATAQRALSANETEHRQAAAEVWAQVAAQGLLETAGPDELFGLAERRSRRLREHDQALGDIPPRTLAHWDREYLALTDAALAYLNFRYEHLRARREP